MTTILHRFVVITSSVCLSLAISTLAPSLPVWAQARTQADAQYKAAAQKAIKDPFKVDVQPAQQGVKQGSATTLTIQLRNANNEMVNATQKMTFEVTTKSPSGAEQRHRVDIPAGSSNSQTTVKIDEPGLSKLEVHESKDQLIGGSNYLLVSPSAKSKKPLPKSGSQGPVNHKNSDPPVVPPGSASIFGPRLVLASYNAPDLAAGVDDHAAPEGADPRIILTVSGEGDGKVLGDGISTARVSAFLLSPQSTDVSIWLQVSHGKLAASLLVITQGDVEAHVDWTSTEPVDEAEVWISHTNPPLQVEKPATARVQFTDPIVAIAFANPPSKLSIVELGTVAVRFINRDGIPVQAHMPHPFRFSVDSPHVRVDPVSNQTKSGDADFSTSVIPAALGVINIEAAVPGYKPVRQAIQVTGLLLLGFCVVGGALGGLVNHYDLKQKGLAASLLTGMVVALPITWAYVWLGLPNINTAILHNQLSAVMIAIIAGMSGAAGLKRLSTKAGFDLFV